jgi:hypothetical protein
MFANLAKFKFIMANAIDPIFTSSVGCWKAKTPIPKNIKTKVSAEYDIVS